jgi:hypothetical protein
MRPYECVQNHMLRKCQGWTNKKPRQKRRGLKVGNRNEEPLSGLNLSLQMNFVERKAFALHGLKSGQRD